MSGLSGREDAVGRREIIVSAREKDIDAEIKNKAANMVQTEIDVLASGASNQRNKLENAYAIKSNKLQRQYKQMKAGYRGAVFFTLFYSIITTILTAFKTEVIGNDFMDFINAIISAIQTLFEWSVDAGSFVAKLGDKIPNTMVASMVHWLLVAVVCAGLIGCIGVTMYVIGKKYVKFFKEKQMEEISILVGFLIPIMIVFMTDFIKSIIPINLYFVAIMMFVGYTVIRGIIQVENPKIKKRILKYSAIVVGGLGVFSVMIHFFGIAGIIAIPIGCCLTSSNR